MNNKDLSYKPISRTIFGFMTDWRRGTIIIDPDIQRKTVWPLSYKIGLIDTLIKGYPIPLIFVQRIIQEVDGERKEILSIIDGQQRMTAIKEFLDNKFCFRTVEPHNPFFKDADNKFDKKFFKDLDKETQRNIEDYDLPITRLENFDKKDASGIFSRLNKNVIKVNDQELRNAEFFGDFKKLVYGAEIQKIFISLYDYKLFNISDIRRMLDIEYISDLFVFLENGIVDKNKKTLDKIYEVNEEMSDKKVQQLKNKIKKTINIILKIFKSGQPKLTRFLNKHDFYTLFTVINELVEDGHIFKEKHYKSIYNTLETLSAIVHEETTEPIGNTYYIHVVNRQGLRTARKKRHRILYELIQPIIPTKKDKKRLFSNQQRTLAWSMSKSKKCKICGKTIKEKDYELDHKKPHSKGGLTSLDNAQITHKKCNINKRDN